MRAQLPSLGPAVANKTDHPQLDAIVATLAAGKTAEPTTIREFLSWFGAQRRTRLNVEYIEGQLAKAGLKTVPGYLNRWVDAPVTFELASKTAEQQPAQPGASVAAEKTKSEDGGVEEESVADDPSFRIGNVKSATAGLVSVPPNASLQQAVTLMMTRNYSQLPVMNGSRDVRGVISWKSIGARLAANISSGEVRIFMDAAKELPIDSSLFAGIPVIADHGYVLIRAENKELTGIVTASDIAFQFEDISKPFLLLAEIENQLRSLINRKLNKADIKKANADEFLPPDFGGVHALTFANCVAALSHPENWDKLNFGMDRKLFCAELAEINKIRNAVMHFNPDPPNEDAMRRLHDVSNLLGTLRQIGAF